MIGQEGRHKLCHIIRNPTGRESRKIQKFRKNQKLEKPIQKPKNSKLVCFRPRRIQKTQKKIEKFC